MVVAGRDELVARRLLGFRAREAASRLEAVPPIHDELQRALGVQTGFLALGEQEVK
jgi:hypothetical protein